MSLLSILLYSYLFTLFFELLCGLQWGLRKSKELLSLICINTITNPPAVLFTSMLRIWLPVQQAQFCILILEVLIVGMEAVFVRYFLSQVRSSILFSVQANVMSFVGGAVLFRMLF